MKKRYNYSICIIFLILFSRLSVSNAQTLIINEISQGPSGSKEYVEFLVIPTGAINPCQANANCLDLRGWIIDDNNGFFTPGSTSGVGLAQGALRFSNSSFWSCIPVGTLIVVYNDADPNASLPANDVSMNDGNCRLILPASSALIEGNANNPSAVAPLTYTVGGWVAGSGIWSYTGMANGGDSYQIYAPFATNIPAHSVSWGNNSSNTIIYFLGPATATVYYFNSASNNPYLQNNWSSGSSPAVETPGAGNNAANTAYIQSLTNNCTPFVPLIAHTSSVNALCACNGSVSASPTGGNGIYTYVWTNAQGQVVGNTANLSNLCAGWYHVQVSSGGCSDNDSVQVMNNGVPTNPTFANFGPYCQGAAPSALPLTSNNGVNGTWSPATISTAASGSTVYTFTPSAGQCANNASQTVVVNANTSPTFSAFGPYCQGAAPAVLPLTSSNGVNGTWSPATISTAASGSIVYTFTPSAGQCANNATQTVVVNANTNPTFSAFGPYCQGAAPAVLPLTSSNGVNGTWSPATISTSASGSTVYTFTPSAAQCANNVTQTVVVNANTNPTFSAFGPYCQGAAPAALPLTSSNGVNGTWSPATISTAASGSTVYTFNPSAGQCANNVTQTVVVNANTSPTFSAFGPYCQGAAPAVLPLTSNNGVNGTWSPATISTAASGSTIYTFTPSAGQCANNVTQTVLVNANTNPTFSAFGPYCQGAAPAALPLTSSNGVNGTWSPATISTSASGSTVYTFTPSAGQCANNVAQTVVVNANTNPTFSAFGPYCQSAAPAALPLTSSNGVNGTWSPATISTAASGSTVYTFNPSAGQCANNASQTVVVNANTSPTFSAFGPYCQGAAPSALPLASNNGVNGTWSPATISTAASGSTVYTFTPSAGQCANNATQTVVVNATLSPSFNSFGPYCPTAALPNLPSTSLNGINGTWNPISISTSVGSTNYTFTPLAGQCATVQTLSITITNSVLPTFGGFGPYCQNTPGVPLPVSSNNGITGSWIPPTVNTNIAGSGQYLFAPDAGQCGDTVVLQIQVSPVTAPIFPNLGPYCVGDVASLPNPSVNGISGTWNPPVLNTAQPGSANYQFTPNPGVCATDTVLTLTVLNPQINAGNDTVLCAGNTLILEASGGGNYQWNNGVIDGIPFTPGATTTYVVCGSVGNCTGCDTLLVTVNPAPNASFLSDINGYSVQFTYMGTPVNSYAWDFGDGGNATSMDPLHNYTGPGTYGVLLTVNANGCVDTYFSQVPLYAPGNDAHLINVITPDGDGINDLFDLNLEGYKKVTILIINRWGDLMKVLTGTQLTWDGTVNGVKATDGVYFYKYDTVGFDGRTTTGHGFFHLK